MEILMSSKYPKDKFLYKRLFNLFGQRFLGNGLVTARDHEQWHKQRRIMDPAFSSLYLPFNERADKLMEKLSEEAENKTVANMLHLVNCVALDIITKILSKPDLVRSSEVGPGQYLEGRHWENQEPQGGASHINSHCVFRQDTSPTLPSMKVVCV
ncbi:cholesterol 24-hydroxylase-like isoform X2 [Boleophthalmus pectinirostris]|uniref:cholesterol 24-hydroxylase-like isoform X2 n=1 Tax=Boleophthalmus pectinirostris TaxID=150288 RepID=UPI0024329CC9|nr:cholesterol 24-hydroxylase-like isoform X2 [Boleophthalmus pectinirostris]